MADPNTFRLKVIDLTSMRQRYPRVINLAGKPVWLGKNPQSKHPRNLRYQRPRSIVLRERT